MPDIFKFTNQDCFKTLVQEYSQFQFLFTYFIVKTKHLHIQRMNVDMKIMKSQFYQILLIKMIMAYVQIYKHCLRRSNIVLIDIDVSQS
ncbi:unnamed protein product [Paramecium pentaurelia]|uniref:Uncharacterized protein n=1 Tax=Paramecium pentaurelia TaxID=43138 RepID=A0A8S1TAF4_9CILI|nr:unnamed protein product [Paramecium pentaurelia]